MSARIAEEKVIKATGKGWDHWHQVLEDFGCKEKGHKESAKHLTELGVSMWWAQTITIEYEVSKGIREPSQRSDSKFGLSVQRTMNASVERCWNAFATANGLESWFASGVKLNFKEGGTYSSKDGDLSTFKKIMHHELIRMTWEHPKHSPGSQVNIEFEEKEDRTTIRVSHTQIANKDECDDLKAAWSSVMDGLKLKLES